ncbi:MAG: methionine ABC transporter ATP-binding protein [Alphaproteobacteria bacterium]|nr:methionine ABC transporter ATP-binding protein [Alphaproteobacteria bacterium]
MRGHIGGLVGRSGSGKTTLFRCLSGLLSPDSGSITLNDTPLLTLHGAERRRVLQRIGIVFQHFNLLNRRTVFENVALPLELINLTPQIIEDKVTHLLSLVGLERHANQHPSCLSGGQMQRVAIARALVRDVDLLLCDEFTSALDPETSLEILELLKKLNATLGVTIFLITHDMDVVREICDDVFVMDQGRIIESGSISKLYLSPEHEITKKLFSSQVEKSLPHHILSHLKESPPKGRKADIYLKLMFSDESAQLPLISILSREFTMDINIISGNLDHIREKAFGTLIVSFTYEHKIIETVLDFFKLNKVYAQTIGFMER